MNFNKNYITVSAKSVILELSEVISIKKKINMLEIAIVLNRALMNPSFNITQIRWFFITNKTFHSNSLSVLHANELALPMDPSTSLGWKDCLYHNNDSDMPHWLHGINEKNIKG